MAQATLELIINGSVGSGFSSMMSQVKGAIADFKNETQNSYDAFGAKIDVLKGKATNFQADLAKGRELLKKDIKDGLLPFGAVIAGMTLATKSAIDFEESFADVKKVLNATDAELVSLQGNLNALTNTLPMTHKEINAIAAAAGQMGVALSDIPSFTTDVGKMSVAFDLDAGKVGDSMAKIANVYQIPITQISALGDVINEISNNSPAKAGEIIEALSRIGGQARNFGLAAEDAAALTGSLIAMGTAPEVAARSLGQMLNKLQTAEQGGKKFQDALDKIGISAAELKESLKNPQEGLMNFLRLLERVPQSDRAGILTDLFGRDHQARIATLVGSLNVYQAQLENVKAAEGSLQKEFAARSATTANRIQLFKNALNGLSITLGNALLPAITNVLNALTPVVQVVGSFLAQNPRLTTGLLMLVGGLMAGRVAASAFFLGLNYLVTAGTMLWKVALVGANIFKVFLVPAIKLVGTAIAFVGRLLLLNPIGLLITGIATAAFLIYKYWEPIKKFFSGLWDTIKSVLSGLYEKMVSFGSHLIEGLIEGLKKSTGALWQAVKDAGSAVKDAFKSVLQINSPSKVFQGFGENIGQGLILGVNATKGAANRAMSELANPRLKTGGAGFGGGAAGNMRITYSPTINLAGAAENVKREVSDALKNSQVEFEKMFKRMVTQNERRALVW